MKRTVLLLQLLLATIAIQAQGDVEYRAEIGGGVGLVAYEGDFNGNILKGQQPMAEVVFRRLFNPRSGLKLAAAYGQLKGSSENSKTYYPDFQETPYQFKTTLVDASLTYEYNFWPYGTGREYRGAKRTVPYILIGLGATYASTDNGKKPFSVNMPIGLGVKHRIGDRLNIGFEWAMHFSGTDELDGVRDPYHIKSSGIFKNTDCYSMLRLAVTYSFMAKCKTCHNADE